MSRLLPVLVLVLALGAAACADGGGTAVGSAATDGEATAGEPTGPDGTGSEAATGGGTETATEGGAGDAGSATGSTTYDGTLTLVEVEGGCVALEADDGERYQLVAAPGADLAVDPGNGVVATGDGDVVASVGDDVTVTGQVDEGMMTFCQIGPVLAAEAVEVR